jgi:hypothetical protein
VRVVSKTLKDNEKKLKVESRELKVAKSHPQQSSQVAFSLCRSTVVGRRLTVYK